MLDSETYYFINYFYVFDAISAKDGSKCSYLQVLKTYINRIGILVENTIFTSRLRYDTSITCMFYLQKDPLLQT